MTPDQQAGCEGKHPFDSAAIAWRVMSKSRKARQLYRCAFCGYWHVAG